MKESTYETLAHYKSPESCPDGPKGRGENTGVGLAIENEDNRSGGDCRTITGGASREGFLCYWQVSEKHGARNFKSEEVKLNC